MSHIITLSSPNLVHELGPPLHSLAFRFELDALAEETPVGKLWVDIGTRLVSDHYKFVVRLVHIVALNLLYLNE